MKGKIKAIYLGMLGKPPKVTDIDYNIVYPYICNLYNNVGIKRVGDITKLNNLELTVHKILKTKIKDVE